MRSLNATRQQLRALYSDDHDARRWIAEGFVYFTLIHLQLAAVIAGWLPAWSLPLVAPLWMARMMIGRHELIHVRSADQVRGTPTFIVEHPPALSQQLALTSLEPAAFVASLSTALQQ